MYTMYISEENKKPSIREYYTYFKFQGHKDFSLYLPYIYIGPNNMCYSPFFIFLSCFKNSIFSTQFPKIQSGTILYYLSRIDSYSHDPFINPNISPSFISGRVEHIENINKESSTFHYFQALHTELESMRFLFLMWLGVAVEYIKKLYLSLRYKLVLLSYYKII